MLRGELLNALAAFGHDETINEAIRRFHIFLDDRNTAVLPPDLRRVTTLEYIATQNSFLLYLMQILIPPSHLQAVYVAVMQRVNKSDRSGFEALLRVYRETDLSQEKTRVLSNLSTHADYEIKCFDYETVCPTNKCILLFYRFIGILQGPQNYP